MVFLLHLVSLNRAFRFTSRSVCVYTELTLDFRTMRYEFIMVTAAGFSARYGVITGALVKNQLLWDMTSHPRSLEYAVTVLWHIVCNVAAHFLCV